MGSIENGVGYMDVDANTFFNQILFDPAETDITETDDNSVLGSIVGEQEDKEVIEDFRGSSKVVTGETGSNGNRIHIQVKKN